jgi:MFS family permease
MSAVATRDIQTRGLKGFFDKHRSLDSYPTGAHRRGLLLLTLVANSIMFYDVGFAGLLPLWMSSLHFTANEFGSFMIVAVVMSGIGGLFGGPLSDRHGRVVIIDLCVIGQITLSFANLLMFNYWSFVVVRGLMFVLAGLAFPASNGLIRDLTPRLGRASGFGLLGLGATASQCLWTFIPGVTLSHFHTWQSQVWIMSFIGLAFLIPVLLWLKDLHASFRFQVVESESAAAAVRKEAKHEAAAEVPATALAAFGALVGRWEIWVLVFGCVLMVTVPITMQTFGPLMFVQAFKYTPAQASKMASYFFLTQTLAYFPGGYLADVLRMRKAVSFVAAAAMASLLAWWAGTFAHPISPAALAIVNLLLGGVWSVTHVSWAGFYSEYVEDLAPALQATGWAFFQVVFRCWLASASLLQPRIARHYGWGTWIWVVAIGVFIYMVSLVVVPGHWGRKIVTAEMRAAAAHA